MAKEILKQMYLKGEFIREDDYANPFRKSLDHYFQTGKYESILYTADCLYSVAEETMDELVFASKQYLVLGYSDYSNRDMVWPEWANDFEHIRKLAFLIGCKRGGGNDLLCVIQLNVKAPPENDQLDVFVDGLLDWSRSNRSDKEPFLYFVYSFKDGQKPFGMDLLKYCQEMVSKDKHFIINLMYSLTGLSRIGSAIVMSLDETAGNMIREFTTSFNHYVMDVTKKAVSNL